MRYLEAVGLVALVGVTTAGCARPSSEQVQVKDLDSYNYRIVDQTALGNRTFACYTDQIPVLVFDQDFGSSAKSILVRDARCVGLSSRREIAIHRRSFPVSGGLRIRSLIRPDAKEQDPMFEVQVSVPQTVETDTALPNDILSIISPHQR